MAKLKQAKLSDLCFLVTDGTHDSPKLLKKGYPLIKGKDINQGFINFENCDYISLQDHLKVISRSKPEYSDILFANIGNIGDLAYVNTTREFSIKNVALIKPDKSKIDNLYLYYYMLSPIFQDKIKSIKQGSAQPFISLNLLRNFEITIINNIAIQNKIAKILSNYDDLIENNNRRIKILEEMAQKIYKEWFVDFKFPGHETATFKDSPLGKIPNDWEVIKANNVADIFIGRTPSRKDFDCFTMNCKDRKWISIKDIGLSNAFVFQTSEYLTEDAIIKYNVPIIPKDTVILSFKLTVGKVAITTEAMCSNEAIAQFQIKDKQQLSTNYLYLYLKNFKYSNLGNTSSIGNAINSTIVKNMNILIPQSSILSEFNKSINGIFEQIKSLSIKNENLKQTRDLLLPRLISGEINVENMEVL